ncbi:MAG TPA: hypothetical protein VMV10_26505 [Pirellulales bacterium]|nr:hypothetical protein [Pirellulales bacterium]
MTANQASKTASSTTPRPVPAARRLFRDLVTLGLLCGALAAGGYAVWLEVRERVLDSDQYRVCLENVVITPPAEWIRSDVKAEVLRDAEANGALSVLDEDLAKRMHQAFSAHPWVARVVRVAKLPPARLHVELVYRKPVCMVQVAEGLFPIDETGVLLPTADFSPHEAARYPRYSNAPLTTEPPAGSVWQEQRIFAAAQLALVLGDVWEEFNFEQFEPQTEPGSSALDFQLVTKKGTRVLWGAAPTTDEAGQALAKAKLAKLKQYFAERGTLEGSHGRQDLDLRHGELQVLARTALAPNR